MRKTLGFLTLLLAATLARAAAAPPLSRLKIDASRTAVVGLSSGAYMAGQAQLAYPELFPNAAIVAGGPYGCAGGKLDVALGSCMKGVPAPDVGALVASAGRRSASGEIGALKNLAHARVYLLHGKDDVLVAPAVAEAGAQFYRQLRNGVPGLKGMQVHDDGQRAFAHNLPVAAGGDDCGKSVPPYLGHCGFDAAGEIFAQMFGKPPRAAGSAQGELRRFDQDALRPGGADAFLADTGYVYLPPACLAGKPCGVVVVFHGCRQNAAAVGEAFVEDAGFNRWADVYAVAVLYPQTRASFAPLNPQACWDWWGYSGADYDSRQGVQLRWLVNAVRALGMPAGH
ncbi:poly (3-hydroxybutyrate) depolymerase (PhaZ) [Rhodanobacter sp. FW510-R12]|uniref:extracellular catalytic domain type 2 short-chain-length polyhydroxyalkanoate depolymerase n=1 Tax=unclassified Rhodanobacter TaxID=2621553 RepID=UPI0007A9BEFA|nr:MULTISPECIES: PHB depolymerase family esterase [unclassified Rhodanobacter]KZC17457.1 poly (3-hydroxybutyrate) depolymerase (PhaZ) [Rhodanobacter sp. FW104-R8]KZC28458.1 poly (3-hydroxybutyrate) depolymerase (PhaZ) [Rhodanobacter sp. FW510-T8]KZC32481.1 poly (3-hydroxybutyrate) depolymerase (PhaZ) [Rhodanobacter sp. FW510-R10]